MTLRADEAGGREAGSSTGTSPPAGRRGTVALLLALAAVGGIAWGWQYYRTMLLQVEVQALRQEAAELRRLQKIPERGNRIPEKR